MSRGLLVAESARGAGPGGAAAPAAAKEARPGRPSLLRRGWAPWQDVAPFVVGLVCFALVAAWDHARGLDLWRNYAISGILLGVPVVVAVARADLRIPYTIQGTIVLALLLHYVGGSLASPDPYTLGPLRMHGVNGAYHTFGWWDHLTHGMGIAAGAMGVHHILLVVNERRGLAWRGRHVALVALASALAAGVAVELYEYLGKTMFQTIDQGGYRNTARDLQFNLLGALAGTAVAMRLRQPPPARGPPRLPPGLAAFATFVAVPAAAALLLAVQAAWTPGNDHEDHLYEGLLRSLVAAALLGVALAPVAWAVRRRQVRRA